MNENVELIHKDFEKALSQRISLLMYCFSNLCTKAEPMALLSLSAIVKKQEYNIEDVAQASLLDEYSYCILPFENKNLSAVMQGAMREHPEWKQEVRLLAEQRIMSFDEANDEDLEKGRKVLVCTVPEVNKERYDVLMQAVDGFYNKCKAEMEQSKVKYLERQLKELKDNSSQEIDTAKEKFYEIFDNNVKIREEFYENKIKEIEEAYEHYLSQQQEKEALKQEEEAARGEKSGLSMNLFEEDE